MGIAAGAGEAARKDFKPQMRACSTSATQKIGQTRVDVWKALSSRGFQVQTPSCCEAAKRPAGDPFGEITQP